MTTLAESRRAFVPGMGVAWLLPLYDPLTRLLRLDRARRDLLVQANLQPGQRVLDIGCGTGSLAVLIKQLHPEVEVVGLDPDEKALARARRKARRAGVAIQFDLSFADDLAYAAASFDRVFSSFMFHHLDRDVKRATLGEVRRVLKDDGELRLLDFGPHSHRRLHDNEESTVVALMTEAGLTDARTTSRRPLAGGLARIVYYQARATTVGAVR
jgi:ubiquinone/menaquinone biosynthesis C-methylase UbiE